MQKRFFLHEIEKAADILPSALQSQLIRRISHWTETTDVIKHQFYWKYLSSGWDLWCFRYQPGKCHGCSNKSTTAQCSSGKSCVVSRGSEKATVKEAVSRRCKRALTLLERTCSGCSWHFPHHRHGCICHKCIHQRFLLCPLHAYPAQHEDLLHERIRKPRVLGEGQLAHWVSEKGLKETSWSFSRLKQMLFKSDVPLCLTFPNGCKGHSLLCLQLDHFQCHQLAVDSVRSQ